MSKVTCIDVSYCQTNVDYAKVKAQGITTVIIRAGYGRETSQKDAQFEAHYKRARAAGLKIGAYWYSYANSEADAKREAAACLACVKGKTFDLPIYYDMEDGSQSKHGKATLTKFAKAFCETIKSGGYRAGVYANLNWFKNYLDYSQLKKKYSIWLAQYNTKNQLDCDIWQNSDNGKFSGISGRVDTNVIYNSNIAVNSPISRTNSKKSSDRVKEWQKAMNMGFDSCELSEDGNFGEASAAFARKHIIYKGMDRCPTAVKWVQKSVGAVIDGIFGEDTHRAVKAFQKLKNLVQDGIVGLETVKAILNEITPEYDNN